MRLDPPLDPSGSEARSQLRRELLRPEYHQQDLFRRFIDWCQRLLDDSIGVAADAGPLSTIFTMLIFLALVLALAWLVSRARRTPRDRGAKGAVLSEERVTAAELRARAEAALDAGRYEEAVVEGFRALAVRQVERGRLSDNPGTTAHEVATLLSGEYAAMADRVGSSAALFDSVLYGGRRATREQATAVLDLDRDLLVRR